MTVWIQPSDTLQQRAGLPSVPLPVSDETAALFEQGTVDLAAIAIDVSRYRMDAGADDPKGPLLDRAVAALAFLEAFELLAGDQYAPAIELLELGLAHEPDNVTLRSHLGTALWDDGHRFDAFIHLLAAVRWFAERGQVAPALWIITSRILQEAGRYQDALALLEDLADTSPREPRFWDLIDAIEAHAAARDKTDPSVRNCTECGARVPDGAGFCTSCGAAQPVSCSVCGAALAADTAFCSQCGQPTQAAAVPAEPAPVARCTHCGAEIASDDSFCTSCGTAVAGATPPPQAATPTVIVAAPSQPPAPPPPTPTTPTETYAAPGPPQPTATAPTETYAAPDPSGPPPTAQFPASPAAPVAPDYSEMAPTPSGSTEPSVRGALLVAAIGLLTAGVGLFFGWIRVPGMSVGGGAAPLDGPTPFRIGDWLDTSVKVDGIAVIVLVVAGATVLTLHIIGRLGGRIAAGTLSGLAALLLLVGLLQLQYIADLGSQFTGSRFQADLGLLLVLGGAGFTLALALLSLAFDRST